MVFEDLERWFCKEMAVMSILSTLMDHRFLILLTELAHISHSTPFRIVVTTEGSILESEMRSEDRP